MSYGSIPQKLFHRAKDEFSKRNIKSTEKKRRVDAEKLADNIYIINNKKTVSKDISFCLYSSTQTRARMVNRPSEAEMELGRSAEMYSTINL